MSSTNTARPMKRPYEGNPKLRITLKKFRKNMEEDAPPMVELSPISSISDPTSLEDGQVEEHQTVSDHGEFDDEHDSWHVKMKLADILLGGLQSDSELNVAKAFGELAKVVELKDSMHNLVQLNGPGIFLTVMNKWPQSAAVQSSALGVFAKLLHYYNKDERETLVCLIDLMKGMETLKKTMERFPLNSQIQFEALSILAYLCRGEKRAEKFVKELDGVDIVCRAMKEHSRNERVQEEGCWLLVCLRKFSPQTPMMQKEALASVCLAVLNFGDSEDIQKSARSYMKSVLGIDGSDCAMAFNSCKEWSTR